MCEKKYAEMITIVQKSDEEWQRLSDEMTPEKMKLIQIIMGLSGEVGEIVDNIKNHMMYGKELDLNNIVEEFGDLYWYLRAGLKSLGINYEDMKENNIKKLTKRYPGGYSREKAIQRRDKEV